MQTNKPNPRGGVAAYFKTCIKSAAGSSAGLLRVAAFGSLLLALLPASMLAQTTTNGVNMSAVPLRITVPVHFDGTVTVSNHVTIDTNIVSSTVNLSISGFPTGSDGSLDKTDFTKSGPSILTVNFHGGVAEGIYNLVLSATGGATNTLLIPIEVGYIWSGASGSDLNWSTAANWTNGVAPGTNDDVIFSFGGATTNTSTNGIPITSIVDQNTTISSLRFAQYATNLNTQKLLINPNSTLSITGTNGFRVLMDYGRDAQTNQMYVSIVGTNATMVVSNQNANFAFLVADNNNFNVPSTLDMSGLGTLAVHVNQVGLGDSVLYPNYWNYQSNDFGGDPQHFLPAVTLARTNIFRAAFADPYDYNNNSNRNYSFVFGRNGTQATSSGIQLPLTLGITNSFQMDSFCFGGFGSAGSSLSFNRSLMVMTNVVNSVTNYFTNTMTAVFRNTNGGRMSMFCLADAGGNAAPASGNTKASGFNGVDFASYNGYVDVLADQFIMSRDNPNPYRSDGCTAQSKMELGAGIFNVNTAILGDQENGNQTNKDYCQAQLIVSNTAVFQVNQNLELGYTTADPSDGSIPGDTYGSIAIGPGGTVIANNIGVGGVTKASGMVGANDIHGDFNKITLTDGAMLVVSNSIGDDTSFPDGGLGIFSFTNSSTLELFLNGNHSGPYVFAKTLTTAGSGNFIQIGAITNLTLPAQVPLIQYASGTPNFTLKLPSGYIGTIINSGGIIYAQISAGTPTTLAWRGYVDNNWNTTTKNWLDLDTGLQTNFSSLDNVSFDDTASAPTNIVLAASSITPGTITMTNNTRTYFITGSGSIVGSAPMFKTGTGALSVQANNTTLAITVDQGLLTGSGTIFSANIGSGATMQFSGTINGNVACAGSGLSSATISGSLDVKPGGVFTNLNNLNNTFMLESNSFMQNSGHIYYFTGGSLMSTVATNAYLLNLGPINGDLMQVDGTLNDSSSAIMQLTQLSIDNGATFIPGGDGISSSTISPNGGVGNTPGRLTLNTGSKTIIKVNPGTQTSTIVYAGANDFGPSQSGQAQNGCTLVITNVTGTAFAAGQVFDIFWYKAPPFSTYDTITPTGASTNSFPVIDPPTPGPGLCWDLRQLWPNGYIGVTNTPTITLTNTFTMLGTTNLVTTFTWPTNFTANWVLETQANPLSVGLSNNWSRIPGTWTNTAEDLAVGFKTRVITNSLMTTNPAVFYRLVYP